ncbi:PEFG-CTERM sorting domain-containing protein [Nitrosopumilus sp. Nsub]|uniref:PEFG-CTERM sorting domain-containing protein n=1 Tax=Nitrosopumilus sp. Nsub TaxID=1776294 RepID=UPI0032AF10D4
MSVTSVHQDAFAKDAGMSLTAVAEEDGAIISVSGETTSNITDVTFRVISPNGQNVVAVDQVAPDANGEFSTQFNVSNWSQDGMYQIKANQGTSLLYSITVSVDVNGGMTAETSATQSSMVDNYASSEALEVTTTSTEDVGGLTISANAVEGSDTIEITGQTSKTNQDVTFTVTSPNGNLVSVDQISPESSGDFATDILVGGPLWSQDGAYTVTAQQGSGSAFTDSVEVEVADGLVVPEFGTIAAMILAVAIISIVAISAKSRLSIVPRY